MALLTLRLYDANGVPAAASGPVTLTDSTNAWGIIRDRDNAVMLAAGAATSNPSTGVYTYDYTALGLDPLETYIFSFKYGTTSFQVGTIPAVGGTTLRRARRELAERLAGARAGSYELVVAGVQAAPPDGVYAGIATGTDDKRRIVSTDLARLDATGLGAGASPSLYVGGYAYVLSTVPEQRAIDDDGYVSNTDASDVTDLSGSDERVGYLRLKRRLAAAVPAGTEVEIHTRLPVLRADGKNGLHRCINEALQSMRVAKRLSVSALTGDYRYDYGDDWVRQGGRIAAALEPESTVGYEPYPVPGGQMVRADAEMTYVQLDTTYNTGQTFYLDTERPAKSWIRTGGTWQASSVGLVHESDEAAVPLRWLTLVAYYYACKQLAKTDPRGENTFWKEESVEAMRAAAPYLMYDQQEAIKPVGAGRYRRSDYSPKTWWGSIGRGGGRWP